MNVGVLGMQQVEGDEAVLLQGDDEAVDLFRERVGAQHRGWVMI